VVVKFVDEEKQYTLHEKLLTYYSGYFRQELLSGPLQTGVIYLRLHEITIDAFDVFVDWMYEKTLPPRIKCLGRGGLLTRAYILADILSVSKMKTALIDVIYSSFGDRYFTFQATIHAFKHLPANDPMLQLVVDTFCINNGLRRMGIEYADEIDELPKEFLLRVFRKLQQLSELPGDERRLKLEDYSMVVCMKGGVGNDDEWGVPAVF
jgi:hypothetical protein